MAKNECTNGDSCFEIRCPTCDYLVPDTGWTQNQLRAVFSLVENKTNWKLPVEATTTWEQVLQAVKHTHLPRVMDRAKVANDLLRIAVTHFTGSAPGLSTRQRKHQTVVSAPGYYESVGA